MKQIRQVDVEYIPVGSKVSTPSGKVGIVVKHHTTSKIDHFERVSVQFGENPRDGVVLQPHLLTVIEIYKWTDPDAKTLAMRIKDLCQK